MATRKRLTPPLVRGTVLLSDGLKGDAERLQRYCSMLEEAMLLAGASPGVDYTHRDLMAWALEHDWQNTELVSRNRVASALRDLGNGNAATPMGALEALGLVLKEGMSELSDAVRYSGE